MLSIRNKTFKILAVASAALLTSCSYTDYPGHPGHKTSSEAYLPSLSIVISGFGDEYNGTYVYSAEYDNREWMEEDYEHEVKISTYRNVVTDSYPHRPGIQSSAEEFDGATGFSGGQFKRYWVATDRDSKNSGGIDNLDRSFPLGADGEWLAPGMILVLKEPVAEIDEVDWDLQSTVKSASQLFNSLLSVGEGNEPLSLSVSGVELNGQVFKVDPFAFGFKINQSGLKELSIRNQPSAKQLLNTILSNTENLVKVDLALHLDNGMEIALPKHLSVMFNHKVLSKFAK